MGNVWGPLANAIAATGTDGHVDALIDLIGADVPHDFVTVTRYSVSQTPEFVKHRGFSDEMVGRYLATFHAFDPFHAAWRQDRRLGILPLKRFADDAAKRGRYIAEFLAQSKICDEVGILLADGGDWCLGIFLDRSTRAFRDSEVALLTERLPVFAALHALDLRSRAPGFSRSPVPVVQAALPHRQPGIPAGLWPDLSPRERELVSLVLAGHPTATIAQRLGITTGTVKNHRRRIHDKLDITTERELFLQFFQHPAEG